MAKSITATDLAAQAAAAARAPLAPKVAVRRFGGRLIVAYEGQRQLSLSVGEAAELIVKLLREAPELGGHPVAPALRRVRVWRERSS